MNKRSVLLFGLVSLVGLVSAQAGSQVQSNPGFVKAGSPFYSVDTALDNAGINMKSDGEVVYERASEYSYAQERNRSQAVDRANQSLQNAISKVASSNETKGLAKAEAVLQKVQNRTPDQANAGIKKALSNVQKARNGTLKPEDVGKPEGVGKPSNTDGKPDSAGRP